MDMAIMKLASQSTSRPTTKGTILLSGAPTDSHFKVPQGCQVEICHLSFPRGTQKGKENKHVNNISSVFFLT